MKFPRKASIFFLATMFAPLGANAAYVSNEVLVKYKDDSVRTAQKMNLLYKELGVSKIRRFPNGDRHLEQLILSKSGDIEGTIDRLMQDSMVEYAQPNYLLYLPKPQDGELPIPCIPGLDMPGCDPDLCWLPGLPLPPGCQDWDIPGGGTPGERPELQDPPAEMDPPQADTDLEKTYGLYKIHATHAWDIHKGSKDFIVAVIDTGADYNHQDLSFNMWRNPNPTENDIVGFDFIHNDGLPYDDQSHGTHVSGTIGGVWGNGVGVSGVAPRVSIMALKFLSSEGSGTTADAIRAIDYAVVHGAKVLSNSWGGGPEEANEALSDSITHAMEAGTLFIAAAGNSSADNDGASASYPAAFTHENIIAVAATGKSDELASFSNYGKKSTDLGAPGVDVYSSLPNGQYGAYSGTSMACPHVSGAAALLWSYHPDWNYKQVKDVLLCTVDPVNSLKGKTVTEGRLNLHKAMQSSGCDS